MQEEPAPPENLRIVLVEDHAQTRNVLTRLLEKAGHTVVRATSVSDARSRMREQPDMLISDIGLPDGSGLEVANDARKRWPGLRCIALSGYGSDEDIERSRQAGFQSHLVKPITAQKLMQAIGRAAQ
jgi:CheY-like chemotaxis protein